MVILVLNCGSSSIKYQVIDMTDAAGKLLAKGLVERIGLPEGILTHKPVGKTPFELHQPIPDHTTGIKLVLDALTDPTHGVIASLDEVKAVGHRVAHGGEYFRPAASSPRMSRPRSARCARSPRCTIRPASRVSLPPRRCSPTRLR